MKGVWHVYECPPIDLWAGWHSLARVPEREIEAYSDGLPCKDWLVGIIPELARTFRKVGWRGDGHWHLTAIPFAEPETVFAIAVKQDHAGTTYIASEIALPWLRRQCTAYLRANLNGDIR